MKKENLYFALWCVVGSLFFSSPTKALSSRIRGDEQITYLDLTKKREFSILYGNDALLRTVTFCICTALAFFSGYLTFYPKKVDKIPFVTLSDDYKTQLIIACAIITLLMEWVAILQLFNAKLIYCSKDSVLLPNACKKRGRLAKLWYWLTFLFRARSIDIDYEDISYIKIETVHKVLTKGNQYSLTPSVEAPIRNNIFSIRGSIQHASSSQEEIYQLVFTISTKKDGDYMIYIDRCQKDNSALILYKFFRKKGKKIFFEDR